MDSFERRNKNRFLTTVLIYKKEVLMKTICSDVREEKIFLIAYSLWLTSAIINITTWNNLEIINELCVYVQKFSYIFLIIQFLIRGKYTKKDVFGIFAIIIANIWSYYVEKNGHIMSTMVWIYFSANVDYRKILKCTLIIQGTIMVITISASCLGIIENQNWIYAGNRVRQSIGYDYCAYSAHLMLFLTLIWVCLRTELYLVDAISLIGINYLIYKLTDSRADFILCVIAIIGFCFWGKDYHCRFVNGIRNILIKYACVIWAIFSIAAQYFYDASNGNMRKLDMLLTNRLQLGHDAIQTYGFNLFGHVVRWIGAGGKRNNPSLIYNYVDCAFLKETITFGIVFLILLMIVFYWAGKELVQNEEYMMGWAIIISLLYGVVNAHLCMAMYNVFILKLGCVFSNKVSMREKRKKI